jgi:shikimate dehydrogenase
MHMAGYRALGLNYFYMPFQLREDQLQGALAGMRALGIRGFGVSMPFKLSIMELLDELDPLAERIGAVNTVVNDGGRLTGYNTDAWGACAALREVVELKDAQVLLLGAGGAARAVGFGLIDAGARVHVVNRTAAKGEALAQRLSEVSSAARFVGTEAPDSLADYAIVLNASAVGMSDYLDESPVALAALNPDLVVMDIVYKPVRTRLVQAAERAQATTIHGGRMLLYQASRQFSLYTGQPAPLASMDAALQASLAR